MAAARVDFPFLALLVSGGHCQILLVRGVGSYVVLGGTLDDALGEAYDKAARMLGLRTAGAGGPALEALAREGDATKFHLPVPMQKRKDCDFSYAGLKNAFRLAVQKAIEEERRRQAAASSPITSETDSACEEAQQPTLSTSNSTSSNRYEANKRNTQGKNVNVEEAAHELPSQVRADLAASFQRVAIRHLTERVNHALDLVERSDFDLLLGGAAALGGGTAGEEARQGVRTLAVVGGVAANEAVRSALSDLCAQRALSLVAPPPRLCTDNGIMVAWAAIEKLHLGISDPINLPAPPEDEPSAASSTENQESEGGTQTKKTRKKRSKDVRPRWPLGPELSSLL